MNTTTPRLFSLWLTLVGITAAWEWSGLDLHVMRLTGSASGFAWQTHWFLSQWLHVGMRQVFLAAFVVTILWAIWPARWQFWCHRQLWIPRRERLAVLLIITLCLLAISLGKKASQTSCPWDLQEFGGVARYVPHWDWRETDGGPGRCFPGGHASSALAFLALALPWLVPLSARPALPRRGWVCLAALITIGFFLGTVQTLRGAHYPSHTLWTLLICSGLTMAVWRLLTVMGTRRLLSASAAPQAGNTAR